MPPRDPENGYREEQALLAPITRFSPQLDAVGRNRSNMLADVDYKLEQRNTWHAKVRLETRAARMERAAMPG